MVTKEKVRDFPDAPGVYIMKDKDGQVIYVGKALSLKKRTRSYFLKNQASVKVKSLLYFAESIEYIQTLSEYDALILEADLIKQHKPRFNVSLKDDKSFPFIKITKEEFPRVYIGRRNLVYRAEDVDNFGPYTNIKILRKVVAILRKSFPFRSCRNFPKKACLNYCLNLCPAPCVKKISSKKYLLIIKGLSDFLLRKDAKLVAEISSRMQKFARQQRFEEAKELRDQLTALSLLFSLKEITSRKTLNGDGFKVLGLSKEPLRIEVFDVSNTVGREAVASMISFYKGRPDKDNYRRFKIREVSGVDDYAMIREAVRRRYERLLKEHKEMPDLIVVDGGLGHLESACSVLAGLKINIPIIAIAKREELIYTIGDKNPVKLGQDSVVLQLIQRGRDEAHRFALKYHKLLRKKNVFR